MNLILNPPKQVVEVLRKLESHGYDAYIHGECVRTLMTDDAAKIAKLDFEITTEAEIHRILSIFDGFNVVDTSNENGEITVIVLGVAAIITSYSVHLSKSIPLSLNSLDRFLESKYVFSFDAVAYSLEKGVHSPFGGIDDINSKTLNFIESQKPPSLDNVLLAISYLSSGEFVLSESAKTIINSLGENLNRQGNLWENKGHNKHNNLYISENLSSIIMGRDVFAALTTFESLFTSLIPELCYLNKLEDDTLNKTFKAVGCSPPILTLRYAILFHEIGKWDCHSKDNSGNIFYHGHGERGAIYARRIMLRLGYALDDTVEIMEIIRHYQKPQKIFATIKSDNKNKSKQTKILNRKQVLDAYNGDGAFTDEVLRLLLLFNYAVHRSESTGDDTCDNDDINIKISAKKSGEFKRLASLI